MRGVFIEIIWVHGDRRAGDARMRIGYGVIG